MSEMALPGFRSFLNSLGEIENSQILDMYGKNMPSNVSLATVMIKLYYLMSGFSLERVQHC